MKTKAVRLYGKDDLRLEEFDLPAIKPDEILARVISDSICMSSYKATKLGADHRRVPNNVHEKPIIIGHEFSGTIIEVGKKWKSKYKQGNKFSIQPALNYRGKLDAPGYSYQYIGGDATFIIIPNEVMEMDCLLEYYGNSFYMASLSEPMSCIIGAFHSSFHTNNNNHTHNMGIKENGAMAILAGVGPMGLGAIDYAIHCNRRPKLVIVTDIDDERLKRAAKIHTREEAAKNGVRLVYLNTLNQVNVVEYIKSFNDGISFDDIFVFAPLRQLVEQADQILGFDGCLNLFAGPSNPAFKAEFNFYNVHYSSSHIVGTSGGNTDDMREALDMMSKGLINPAVMVTHIGGLDAVAETTKNLPDIPGGKKLIYTNVSLPLTALSDFELMGKTDPFFNKLHKLVNKNNGIWSDEAEKYLLQHANKI